MKRFLLVLLVWGTSLTGFSQTKAGNIQKLLDITGAGKLGIQLSDALIDTYKKSFTSVPVDFWNDIKKEFNADTIINMVIPVYAKYYTDEEVIQLVEFYQTPLGKKVISNTPLVMQESMAIGQAWGREMGERVYKKLVEKGLIKDE